MMSQSHIRVAIVGGGLAGMSAAHALSKATQGNDVEISLFEAKRQTGGRAGSFYDQQTGETIDYCQHVAMGCCTQLLGLLQETDLLSEWTRYRELSFHHPQHPVTPFRKATWLPAPAHFLPTLLKLPYLSWRQRLEIGWASFRLMRTPPAAMASVSAQQWLLAQRQSPNTIRDYWDVVITSALGESSARVSMSAARKVFIDGFLACHDASDVWVPRLPLAELFGKRLPGRLTAEGTNICTGAMIRSVDVDQDGVPLLHLERDAVRFDHVILALPSSALAKILGQSLAVRSGLSRDALAQVRCSPITGVHLWFDRPVMSQPHAVMVGTLSQWVFNRDEPTASQTREQHYIQVVVSASHDLRSRAQAEVIAEIVTEIQHAFPAARQARLLHSRMVTDPLAVFSIAPDTEAQRPSSSTAIPSVHLAGDFVQTGWPATMEGAVISGQLAAASVLRQLGRPALPFPPALPAGTLAKRLIRL